MVIKGKARGGAGSLATHLLRTDHNERVHLHELRGVVAEDLEGALREMAASVAEARTRRPFYHGAINSRADEALTDEQKARAIDRLDTNSASPASPGPSRPTARRDATTCTWSGCAWTARP